MIFDFLIMAYLPVCIDSQKRCSPPTSLRIQLQRALVDKRGRDALPRFAQARRASRVPNGRFQCIIFGQINGKGGNKSVRCTGCVDGGDMDRLKMTGIVAAPAIASFFLMVIMTAFTPCPGKPPRFVLRRRDLPQQAFRFPSVGSEKVRVFQMVV
jgi:hypothetical protein